MASKRNQRRKGIRVCQRKKPYETRESAAFALVGLRRHTTDTTTISIYHCPYCSKWHVGHRTGASLYAEKERKAR
jgi:hypothetical protein